MALKNAQGVHQSARSVKGMFHAKKSAGSETIRAEEHVGSPAGHGIRFKMPKGMIDHSRVRSTIGKK
jgi:hypothetical protein